MKFPTVADWWAGRVLAPRCQRGPRERSSQEEEAVVVVGGRAEKGMGAGRGEEGIDETGIVVELVGAAEVAGEATSESVADGAIERRVNGAGIVATIGIGEGNREWNERHVNAVMYRGGERDELETMRLSDRHHSIDRLKACLSSAARAKGSTFCQSQTHGVVKIAKS